MRPNPKLPDDSVNISPVHPLKEAATLITGVAILTSLFLLGIGFFVDLAVPFIPPSVEAKFSQKIWEKLDVTIGLKTEQESSKIKNLVLRLASHWEDNPYEFRVMIVKADGPNAFALPGGLIGVTSGLIDMVESENELAFVLSHELGHFKNRDHLKILGRGIVFNLLLAAVGSQIQEFNVVGISGILTRRAFSRNQERAADRFGLTLMQKEYHHVAGSTQFFKRLAEKKLPQELFANFAGSHPTSLSRVSSLKSYVKEKGWTLEGPLLPPIE